MTTASARRRSADAQGGELNSTQIWLRSCENLVAPMQGEAAPRRLLRDEVNPALRPGTYNACAWDCGQHDPEHLAVGVIRLVAWAILR